MIVYVLNIDGSPIMPTRRCGHVRKLLKSNKAVVISTNPFTIQLKYNTSNNTQSLYMGIDPGRTNIGIAVIKEIGIPVFESHVKTRNREIPKLMQSRKEYRHKHRDLGRRDVKQRRAIKAGTYKTDPIKQKVPGCNEFVICNYIKGKSPKFNNRLKQNGWLTPTAHQLCETHINLVKLICKYLPITDIVIEANKFSFTSQTNQNVNICKGETIKDIISRMQENKCLFYNNDIECYHHVIPRSQNGSNTIDNIVGLCSEHHFFVHTNNEFKKSLLEIKAGLNKKYGALSILNQCIPHIIQQISELFPKHTFVVNGYDTDLFRKTHNMDKQHHFDAYCIASIALKQQRFFNPVLYLHSISQFRRHDRQICHQQMFKRLYYIDGELVAVNRKKGLEQKENSLQEYKINHNQKDLSILVVKHNKTRYKNPNRPMPGSMFKHNNKIFVLKSCRGKHNNQTDYYVDTNGNIHRANQCVIIKCNSGLVFT